MKSIVNSLFSPIATSIRTFACLLLCALAACSTNTATQQVADPTTTFVVVRHAEKATDDARDPSLSQAGHARAQRLARLLQDTPLDAAYATGFRRTQQTAQPAADAHSLSPTLYDAQLPATTLAAQLRAAHTRGTVLVVGHSNTVPDIVSALSGQPVAPIADDQYGNLYWIIPGPDGKPTLDQQSY